MMSMLANFAETGNPSVQHMGVHWPVYDFRDQYILDIGYKPIVKTGFTTLVETGAASLKVRSGFSNRQLVQGLSIRPHERLDKPRGGSTQATLVCSFSLLVSREQKGR